MARSRREYRRQLWLDDKAKKASYKPDYGDSLDFSNIPIEDLEEDAAELEIEEKQFKKRRRRKPRKSED